jgi:hypothetical protein
MDAAAITARNVHALVDRKLSHTVVHSDLLLLSAHNDMSLGAGKRKQKLILPVATKRQVPRRPVILNSFQDPSSSCADASSMDPETSSG